ncbi:MULTISPECIES: PIN domain-containing protein [Rhodanobacter]|uniref:PIN domain-containing protein n=1 Tax=Rhodanobacter TaxID=75309 RepID=UPI00041E1DC7|nr:MULTISPECIES: type II toxin-antitoxin system VapC family toxin [Rhodanobacter]TAN18121.1 MAG: PIN domain-containing protein [Rhodanobacter sp.]UJJ55923.1 type II toxin-antitoxin system VapC family toxin [Rhodanobacter thiooxydans]
MIGLDTHVLVRYIMQDDAAQSAKASTLLDALTVEAPGWISMVSVIELVWVLGAAYGLDRAQLTEALEALLRTRELIVERAEVVWKAVRIYRGSTADFADCLIACAATSAGCEHTMTFDRGAAKHAGMRLMT